MPGTNEKTSDSTTSQPATGSVTPGTDVVDDATYQQMLDILKDLTNHTHIFYDDYGTACNCNCNCTCCIRGMIW